LGFDPARNNGDVIISFECHFASTDFSILASYFAMNIKAMSTIVSLATCYN